ncbi:MAG: glycoside hydrolase family 1 protein [Anaerolineaceae bacterium]|nr:glycoside hydrolase family 1 protein [Anaerolineaceae bacterium]
MERHVKAFPDGFLWGTANSAYQVEGGNTNNDWYEWEQREGGLPPDQRCGDAIDWWAGRRWEEDFDRAAAMGIKIFRISIEWSRVQPAPDRWDEGAITRYGEMVDGLTARGILPMVCLHHFTNPLWVRDAGGWEDARIVDWFSRYARRMVDALGERVPFWLTMNEPNVYSAMGYLTGEYPPAKHSFSALRKVMAHQAMIHAAVYRMIKEHHPQARVGFAHSWTGFIPSRENHPLDRLLAWITSSFYNDFFPNMFSTGRASLFGIPVSVVEARGTQDFIGLNYYTTNTLRFDLRKWEQFFMVMDLPERAKCSPNGMSALVPEGMTRALRWAAQFGLPIIVAENGTEDDARDDRFRQEYLLAHLERVLEAIGEGVNIIGYMYWSMTDNFEWNFGWQMRFGLIEVDRATQTRLPRVSAEMYAKICKENQLPDSFTD